MDKILIINRSDGYISVANFSNDVDESQLDVIGHSILEHVQGGISFRIAEKTEFPSEDFDHEFFDAYQDTGIISIDIAKANQIRRDYFRKLRAPLLSALDIQYMRADELGDLEKKTTIINKKQALRDVTAYPDIDNVRLLKEYMPEILKG